jgi:hypothetical protein
MNVWEIALKLVFGLVPPSVWRLFKGSRLAAKYQHAERRSIDRDVFIWEVFVSITSMGLVGVAVLTFIGNGFALAKDQRSTEKQVIATRLEQLEWRMFDLRVKQCEAIKRGESPQVYTVQLAEQMKTYRAIAGRDPDLPRCEQV